jgi:hypothetical protein
MVGLRFSTFQLKKLSSSNLVVVDTLVDVAEKFPAESNAATLYEYVVDAINPVSANNAEVVVALNEPFL